MRIGVDISQIVYEGTGVATYTRQLVRHLLANDRTNHYTLFGATLRRQMDLVKFIHSLPAGNVSTKFVTLPPTLLEILWNKLHVYGVERFTGPLDVFHTSDWTEPPARIPKVTTIHDMVVYKYPQFLNQRIVQTQIQKLAWVKKESQLVIADSESTKEDIISYQGIAENKIRVVYLGIGQEFFPQKIDTILKVRKKYNIASPYILSVGTREPRKNLQRIIKAFTSLNKEELSLIIVGNFGWGSDIKPQEGVKILNFVSPQDLPALYSDARCFVYPSLYEGFGLPVLEAMACGTVVVTSNRGSLAEITGKAGIVVDPESEVKIAEGLEHSLKLTKRDRTRIIQTSKKHAQTFTWEKTAKKTLEVYKSIGSWTKFS